MDDINWPYPLPDSLSPDEQLHLIERVLAAYTHSVDVSWIGTYSGQEYDYLVECIRHHMRTTLCHDESLIPASDSQAFGDGITRAIDTILTLYASKGEADLLFLLLSTAQHAYRMGVSDANAGALSPKAQAAISLMCDDVSETVAKIRALHEEMSEL